MKHLILSISLTMLWFFGFFAESHAQSNPDFFLAANGVTVMCPNANVGDTGEVNGITYTKRTKSEILTNNTETTCTSGITDMSSMFKDITYTNLNLSTWDVSSVTNMYAMFFNASLFNWDISNWDVSSVTNMGLMFTQATNFNQDLSSWDVSNVKNMSLMFNSAESFNGNISGWDVSGVTDMERMFRDASSFNQDISGWDVSSVTDMSYMFFFAKDFNQDISGWDVSGTTNMANMFYGASTFNQDISGWDVSGVTDMSSMFRGASSFNQDLSGWCVGLIASEPTDFDSGAGAWVFPRPNWGACTNNPGFTLAANGVTVMCTDAKAGEVGEVNGVTYTKRTKGEITPSNAETSCTSGITDMSDMFNGAGSFNGDITTWDVSAATDMLRMFQNAGSFNGDISNWDVSAVTQMSRMFYYANSFNQDLSSWDVSEVTLMNNMFNGAGSFNGNISGWDVSSVTSMWQMFYNANSFNQDISSWDVSGVTDMRAMFWNAGSFNQEIGGWDVSSVTGMSDMFNNAGSFNGDLSSWDVSGVTLMNGMFMNASSFNQDLSGWDVDQISCEPNRFDEGAAAWVLPRPDWNVCFFLAANDVTVMCPVANVGDTGTVNGVTYTKRTKGEITPTNAETTCTSGVTNMFDLFNGAGSFNGDISTWDVSKVTTMQGMFFGAGSFNGDLSGWDVSGVSNMRAMFRDASAFNQNISSWDVSGVTDMRAMFWNAGSFNQDISSWDVSSVTLMINMFRDVLVFNQDLSDWDVSNVTNMSSMFQDASAFNQDISSWDVSAVTQMNGMFREATVFNQNLSGWCVDQITSQPVEFDDGAGAWTLPRPDWGNCPNPDFYLAANNVTVMCPDANAGDTGDINGITYTKSTKGEITTENAETTCTSGITNMFDLFYGAGSFNGDISTWDVSAVTDMTRMFVGAGSFNGDISSWDVSGVTSMSEMFREASAFNQDISSWDVSRVTSMDYMFDGASAFNQDISNWDVSGVTTTWQMFKDAGSFNQDIGAWDVSSITAMVGMFQNATSFNQDLSGWCVEQIDSKHAYFDDGAVAWVLPRPDWGTCPAIDETISGNAGWRMLSLPVGDVTVSSLAGQNLVQGIAGADAFYNDGNNYETAAANLYYYVNTTTDNWQIFDDFDAEISSGQGFIWYMFDNDDVNSVELPFTLSVSGTSPSADVTIPINPSDDFTLIGNPFSGNLDASDVSSWGDLQATARTWDPDAGAEGEYVNTTASTAPFTGFFVEKSESGAGNITIPVAAASSKKADVESFSIALNLQGVNDNDIAISDHSTSVLFREGAAQEWDVYDATKLVPLLSSYATIGIAGNRGGEERIKGIDSQPLDFEDALELPLAFNVSNFDGEFELSAEMENLPGSWSVVLRDNETGETIDLRSAPYSFTYQSENEAQTVSKIKSRMPKSYKMSANEAIHRFTLTIGAGESVSTTEPGSELPKHVALNQNYPNPFNPSTAISYELPEASEVTLQVYDMTGRQIATLINREVKSAGRHSVQFDASLLSSGVYIYRMKAGNTVITKKLTLIK